jgi:hypothetical protein
MSKIDKRSTKRIRTKLWFKYEPPPQSPSESLTPRIVVKNHNTPPLHLRVPASLPNSVLFQPRPAHVLVGWVPSIVSQMLARNPCPRPPAPAAPASFITIRSTRARARALLHHLHISCCPPVYYFSSKNVVEVCDLVPDFSLSLSSCISAVCEACVRLLPPTFS